MQIYLFIAEYRLMHRKRKYSNICNQKCICALTIVYITYIHHSRDVSPHTHQRLHTYIYGPFANYLQVACHEAKIKEETHAGHRNQVFLIY